MIVCGIKYRENNFCAVYKGTSLLYEISSDEFDGLTFTALEDSTIKYRPSDVTTAQYSFDGITWYNANNVTVNLINGQKVYFKGSITGNQSYLTEYAKFSMSGKVKASGNINSMDYDGAYVDGVLRYNNMYYGLFKDCTELVSAPELPATTLASHCYQNMFYGCTELVSAPTTLPATTLAEYCYDNMFRVCTSLVNVPTKLPATSLAPNCYSYMFYECHSLVNAPELPATTLASGCYNNMFYWCNSLVNAPELPATTLASGCYDSMFLNCTSLVNAPELPATTLAEGCYGSMFGNCTSLVEAPELPATTLATACYNYMFYGSRNLTSAPILPATRLVESCYSGMFFGCSNLNYIKALFTTTPSTDYTGDWVLGVAETGTFVKSGSATWDVVGVNGVPVGWVIETHYKITFNSNGGTIPRTGNMGTTPEGQDTYLNADGTEGYVVPSEGAPYFSGMESDCPVKSGYEFTGWYDADGVMVYDSNGVCVVGKYWSIDRAWIGTSDLVLTAGWKKYNDYLNFTALEDSTILFETNNQTDKDISRILNTKYSYDRVNWYDADNVEIQLSAGRTIFYKGEWHQGTTSIDETSRDYGFTITGGEVSAAGSVMSMLGDKDSLIITQNGAFIDLFYKCRTLITAPELPATTLAGGCYSNMFRYCTSLTSAPELPATTLAPSCYYRMFEGCISLTSAPELLPATTLALSCYYRMFYGCISLTTAPVLPATTLTGFCYTAMFSGCSNLNYIKALFTTTPSTDYTYDWVLGVAETGTFVKSSSAKWDEVGEWGVPNGWSVSYQ